MATVRITLSVPEELAGRIKKAAGDGTVSGWMTTIIEQHLDEDVELERQFDEWLAANPPSGEAQRWAAEVLDSLGKSDDRRPDVA